MDLLCLLLGERIMAKLLYFPLKYFNQCDNRLGIYSPKGKTVQENTTSVSQLNNPNFGLSFADFLSDHFTYNNLKKKNYI